MDAATRAQAQKDISEDGYYGVNKTSQRLLDKTVFQKIVRENGCESKWQF